MRTMPDDNGGRLHLLMESMDTALERLSASVREAHEEFDHILRGKNGDSGLLERERKNREAIDALRSDFEKLENTVEMLTSPGRALEAQGIRWKVIGQIVVAIFAVAGVALDILFP